MAYATDGDFNRVSRTIFVRCLIHFEGHMPLEISRDNYLIEMDLLEELTSGNTPFDGCSSNELSLQLQSPEGIFNPKNANSPYFGLMRRNVKITAYVRTSVLQDWYQWGEFYVTSWNANATQGTADIVANDALYSVFNSDAVVLPVQRKFPVKTLYANLLAESNSPVNLDAAGDAILPYGFIRKPNKEALSDLAISQWQYCHCGHDGVITVGSYRRNIVRAKLTDADQLVQIDVKQSLNSDYDSAQLSYNIPSESVDMQLLNIQGIHLRAGSNLLTYNLSEGPVIRLKSLRVVATSTLVVTNFLRGTPNSVVVELNSPSELTCDLTLYGVLLKTAESTLGEQKSGALVINSDYIQDETAAAGFFDAMQNFVGADTLAIEATVRGNPLLQVGDRITLESQRNNFTFDGIILRQSFTYNGGLSCQMTLYNANVLEAAT